MTSFRRKRNQETGLWDERPHTPGEALEFKSKMRRFKKSPSSRKSALKMLRDQGILSDEFITELLRQPRPTTKKR